MQTDVAKVLRIGDPRLREVCESVGDVTQDWFREQNARLHAVLVAFREEHGFGRAVAAPQIGVARRFVALDLGSGPRTLIDPRVTRLGDRTLTLWDDCMSFPGLLVRLRRHASMTVESTEVDGVRREWRIDDPHVAELVQHELDHLDGILAVDRALDGEALVERATFEEDPERYWREVDLRREP
ncbi:MAG: peptide deformylase [Planctomycetota bacterium]